MTANVLIVVSRRSGMAMWWCHQIIRLPRTAAPAHPHPPGSRDPPLISGPASPVVHGSVGEAGDREVGPLVRVRRGGPLVELHPDAGGLPRMQVAVGERVRVREH